MASKQKGFYPTGIVAPAKRVAGTNPVGTPTLGNAKPTIVPEHPETIHGLGPVTKPFPHPSVRGAHGWGHVAKLREGHLRNSGAIGAHRIGGPSKLKT